METTVKDIFEILSYIVVIGGVVYGFFRLVLSAIHKKIADHNYLMGDGIHILKDIESNLGKDAGTAIKNALMQIRSKQGNNMLRISALEKEIDMNVFLCDPTGKCIFVNQSLAELYDMDRSEMLGMGWMKPVLDKKRVYEEWTFAVETKIPYRSDYEILVNGETISCFARAEQQFIDGILVGYVGSITVKTKQEAAA